MVDENNNPEQESPHDETSGPLCGERLAAARRALQIPVIDIAKELHLDEYKVRALENNEFNVIGAPVFAKGHLRKFAQIVRVSEADVMDDYYLLTRSQEMQPALRLRPTQRRDLSPGPWIAAIAVIVVVVTAYWWFAVRVPPVAEPASEQVAPMQQSQQQSDSDDFVEILDDEPVNEEPIEIAAASAAEVETAPADSGVMTLQIYYSGDCWTEISDALGQRLFFDLGKTGRTVNLSGEAPFNVLFGNAANVSLRVNGQAFELPVVDQRGTARLTITGT